MYSRDLADFGDTSQKQKCVAGKEIGVLNLGCVVLGELQVKLSDCTAEGNRYLWQSLKQGKKKKYSFSFFPLLHKLCSYVLRYGYEMAKLGWVKKCVQMYAKQKRLLDQVSAEACTSVLPGLWL